MIEQKPHRGESLQRVANYKEHVNDGCEPVWESAGIVTEVVGNVCYFSRMPGHVDSFIWKFPDSLNKLFRIV